MAQSNLMQMQRLLQHLGVVAFGIQCIVEVLQLLTSSCLQDATNNEVFDTLCGVSWYPLPLDILVLTWIGLTRKRS